MDKHKENEIRLENLGEVQWLQEVILVSGSKSELLNAVYVISNVKDSEDGAKWGFFNDEGSLVKHENPGKELMEHNQKAY